MADDHATLDVVVDPPNADLDIVAIHGLNPVSTGSNAYTTWTYSGSNPPKNWIKDKEFLPTLAPTARIMIFGYNSHAVFKTSDANIVDHAKALLEALYQTRRKKCPDRPLIFICHSLGGLLAKRALIFARQTNRYEKIYTATRGTVFFATPHNGSDLTGVGGLAKGIADFVLRGGDNKFMEILSKSSLCGEIVRKDFLEISRKFKIVSFFESLKKGLVMVVDKDSGTCNLDTDRETSLGINADHSGICKFGNPKAEPFISVGQIIEELADDARASAPPPAPPAPLTGAAAATPATPAVANLFYDVPYQANTKFLGRTHDIQRIHESFFPSEGERKVGPRRLILKGFPGIGKTTIATQYAVDHMNEYEGVFWVTASSDVNQRYRELDNLVKKAVEQTLFQWCADHRWLLIIDNLDDAAVFNQSTMFPPGNGDILITTRRNDLVQLGTVLEIGALTPEDAAKLLLSYAESRQPSDDDEVNSREIARKLCHVPLAIRQCGCLISEQGSLLSEFLIDFNTLMTELVVSEEDVDGKNDTFSLNDAKPILATFELSFAQIQKVSANAAALFEVLGNLDPTDISLDMLKRCLSPQRHWDDSGNAVNTHISGLRPWIAGLPSQGRGKGLENAMKTLLKYSVIARKAEKDHFFVHPLIHFFLGWRQDKHAGLPSFHDSALVLLNGFPHPDFDRIYGLSSKHAKLRQVFLPHVRFIGVRFKKLSQTIKVPLELRPQKVWQPMDTSVISSLPSPIRELIKPLGYEVDPFVQNIRWLPLVEGIIRQMDCPPYLFFHAIYVFFHHIVQSHVSKNPKADLSLEHLALAGETIGSVRTKTLQAESKGEAVSRLLLAHRGKKLGVKTQDILPLIYTSPTCAKGILDRETGMLGLVAVRFTSYLREGMFDLRLRKISRDVRVLLEPDDMLALSTEIPCLWRGLLKRTQFTDSPVFSDLTLFASSQLDLLAYKAMQAPEPLGNQAFFTAPLEKEVDAAAMEAVDCLERICGQESVAAANALFLLFWENPKKAVTLPKLSIANLNRILGSPVTETNYYFKVKLIDAWMHHLSTQEKMDEIKDLLQKSLQIFEAAPETVKQAWTFGMDPILDVLEFSIVLYESWLQDAANAEAQRKHYKEYFEKWYGNFFERLLLGCGVGVFGCSFARIRLETNVFGRAKRPRTAAEIEATRSEHLLQYFQGLFGKSGTSIPEENIGGSRYVEQEWCIFRYDVFLECFGSSKSQRPAKTSFGSMDYGGFVKREGIRQEARDKEAAAIRSLLADFPDQLSALMEASQKSLVDGDPVSETAEERSDPEEGANGDHAAPIPTDNGRDDRGEGDGQSVPANNHQPGVSPGGNAPSSKIEEATPVSKTAEPPTGSWLKTLLTNTAAGFGRKKSKAKGKVKGKGKGKSKGKTSSK